MVSEGRPHADGTKHTRAHPARAGRSRAPSCGAGGGKHLRCTEAHGAASSRIRAPVKRPLAHLLSSSFRDRWPLKALPPALNSRISNTSQKRETEPQGSSGLTSNGLAKRHQSNKIACTETGNPVTFLIFYVFFTFFKSRASPVGDASAPQAPRARRGLRRRSISSVSLPLGPNATRRPVGGTGQRGPACGRKVA